MPLKAWNFRPVVVTATKPRSWPRLGRFTIGRSCLIAWHSDDINKQMKQQQWIKIRHTRNNKRSIWQRQLMWSYLSPRDEFLLWPRNDIRGYILHNNTVMWHVYIGLDDSNKHLNFTNRLMPSFFFFFFASYISIVGLARLFCCAYTLADNGSEEITRSRP